MIALDHEEWLDVAAALARGGPGTPASAADLARFAGAEDDGDDDLDVLVGWFSTVVELWRTLGVINDLEQLTRLGWWGLPEAVLRAWAHEV